MKKNPKRCRIRRIHLPKEISHRMSCDASNTLLIDLIKAALEPHVAKPPYLAGLLKFQDRFDLDGNAAGVVEDKHRARAEKALHKLQQQAATPAP